MTRSLVFAFWGLGLAACGGGSNDGVANVAASSGGSGAGGETSSGGSASSSGGVTASGGSPTVSSGGASPAMGGANGSGGAATSTGGSGGDAGPSDVDAGPLCSTCAGTMVYWGEDGGLRAYVDSSSLAPCRYYDHQRVMGSAPDSALRCNDQYGACGSDDTVTPGAIEAALEDPDVRHALSMAPVFYGSDPRPSDGSAFKMMIGASVLEIGACTGCVPAGVQRLADLLQALDAQELAKPACSSVFEVP